MHKLRAETRNRSSYNSKSDEPSASQAQGVRFVVNQDGECFPHPRASQRVDVFIPTAVLRVCRPAYVDSNHMRPRQLSSRSAGSGPTGHEYRNFLCDCVAAVRMTGPFRSGQHLRPARAMAFQTPSHGSRRRTRQRPLVSCQGGICPPR